MAVQPPLSLHRRIQELLLGFSRGISASSERVGARSRRSASEVNALFGTHRVAVWVHDRRARELALAASSDPGQAAGIRVPTESDTIPARGLRLDGPQFTAPSAERSAACSSRRSEAGGARSAPSIIEGEPTALDDQQFIDAVHDFGRAALVRPRKRPAARGGPAAAPPARGHVQLAHRSGRGHRQRHCASSR